MVDILRGGKGLDPERGRRYVEWMGGLRPPSTLLGVQGLGVEGVVYEVEVVCVVHRGE